MGFDVDSAEPFGAPGVLGMLVWEPPWEAQAMSDAAKERLGWL